MERELENLKLILTSPRERAKGTITSYTQTARTFFKWYGNTEPPTALDLRRFFLWRQENGKSKRTRAKEFSHLMKLWEANAWEWPFTRDDRPVPDDESNQPAFTPEEVEILIKARDNYSPAERFYLAISTTWGFRREEMLSIRKKDYTETVLKVKIAKQKGRLRIIEHLIPEEIRPMMMDYHPKIGNIHSLSYLFYRVMDKSGMGQRKGYGWHAIRRTLRTVLEWNLAERRLPLSLVADYMGWSKAQKGAVYGGAPMLGVYSHQEIMSSEPFAVDRRIISVHPFIQYWSQQTLML
jgi:integrase